LGPTSSELRGRGDEGVDLPFYLPDARVGGLRGLSGGGLSRAYFLRKLTGREVQQLAHLSRSWGPRRGRRWPRGQARAPPRGLARRTARREGRGWGGWAGW